MKRLLKLLPIFALAACADEGSLPVAPPVEPQAVCEANFLPGVVRVRLDAEAESPEAVAEMFGGVLKVREVVKTFPEDPRFVARHKAAGLDLWYDIYYDEEVSLTKAENSVSSVQGVSFTEKIPVIKPTAIMNDPGLAKQWHYNNDGSQKYFKAGIDIGLFDAWTMSTGSEDVIVAVLDGGVRYTHEDLKDAMWRNEAEINGEVGVDDDGNGIVDDYYGYNFCTGNGSTMIGEITFDDHGTHVAGTIGATNNNGTGVCGVAGGNGTHKGVRIMALQMVDDNANGAFVADAFVYAADNGAVIANCSWGSADGNPSESLRTAIKYFNENAGMDADGVQVGKMAGGLAVFAAGNEGEDALAYPACYDEAFSVASIGPGGNVAYYSNVGSWVDICAPGGDYKVGVSSNAGQIYSCVASSDSSYGYMQGTSQAAPHVSGVAALVVSAFGGPGFTRSALISRLQDTADKSIYDDNEVYKGRLGIGMVDAAAALHQGGDAAPAKITDLRGTPRGNNITIEWTVPEDEDDPAPSGYYIYTSDKKFSSPADAEIISIDNGAFAPGDTKTYAFENLDFGKDYYFAIQAFDIGKHVAPLSKVVCVSTEANHKPVITLISGSDSVTLKPYESASFEFEYTDEDGHALSASLSDKIEGISLVKNSDNSATIKVDARTVYTAKGAGTYEVKLVVTDSYDTVEKAVKAVVLENHPPQLAGKFDDVVFNAKSESAQFNLAQYFKDEDGEALTYSVKSSTVSIVVNTDLKGDVLTLSGNSYGDAVITVTATDVMGKSVSADIKVLVRDGSQEADVYPNPVKDYLYVRTGEAATGSVTVFGQNGAKVMEQKVDIGPFSPAQIDMKECASGTYSVKVKTGTFEYRKTIIKL